MRFKVSILGYALLVRIDPGSDAVTVQALERLILNVSGGPVAWGVDPASWG